MPTVIQFYTYIDETEIPYLHKLSPYTSDNVTTCYLLIHTEQKWICWLLKAFKGIQLVPNEII